MSKTIWVIVLIFNSLIYSTASDCGHCSYVSSSMAKSSSWCLVMIQSVCDTIVPLSILETIWVCLTKWWGTRTLFRRGLRSVWGELTNLGCWIWQAYGIDRANHILSTLVSFLILNFSAVPGLLPVWLPNSDSEQAHQSYLHRVSL